MLYLVVIIASVPAIAFSMLAVAARRAPIYVTESEIQAVRLKAERARELAQRVAL